MNSLRLRAPPRTAAEWFAARRGPRDAEFERQFSHWLSANPANAEDYALCELVWSLSAEAAQNLSPDTAERESAQPAGPRWRRPRALGAGIAATAAVAIVALSVIRPATPLVSEWRTGPGEQRTVVLEDGSRMTLNTRSTLEVRMNRNGREIRMMSGEAYFEVAADPARPFIVDTPLGRARAVGTRFNVRLEETRVEVDTEEGKVLVQGPGDAAIAVLSSAGTRATLVRGAVHPALDRADLNRIENWRARRLEFDRVPLETALKEFSRYTAVPIRAATPEIGQMHVSAVLKVGDVAALGATLKGAFGLTVVAGHDEWVVVAPLVAQDGAPSDRKAR